MQNLKGIIYDLKSKNPDLKEAEIEGLLALLKDEAPLSNAALVRKTGLPKETLRNFKLSFLAYLEEPKGDEVKLNAQGLSLLNKLALNEYFWSLFTPENQVLEKQLAEIRDKYELSSKREFDQFFATTRTSVAKALLLAEKGQVKDKSIALLGDDDLVSIALGLESKLLYPVNGQPLYREITVFDIDPALLDVINDIAQKYDLKNIKTELYDARSTIKSTFLHKYDVVMIDPPYTKSGAALFLTRAISLTKHVNDYSGPYVFLFFGNSFKEPEKSLKIQEVIQSYNLVIEDKIDKFARYNGAESIGSASSAYVLKKNSHTQNIDSYPVTEIYTFERIPNESFPHVDHYVFKLYNVPANIINSKKGLQKSLGQFCNWHRLKVVDTKVTKFKGGGLTLTYILAQSNLLVHTWPEKNALHMDLITCTPLAKKDLLAKNLSDLFQTKHIEVTKVE